MATITNDIIDRLNNDSVIAALKAEQTAQERLTKIASDQAVKRTALVRVINEQERAAAREAKAQTAVASGFAAGTAAIGAFGAAISLVAADVDALSDMSARSALSPAFLESLGAAATAGGGKLEDLSGVINTFSRRLGEAASGKAGGAAAAFKALGVAATDAAGNLRPAEVVFSDLITAIAKLPDPTDRAAAAVGAFGKGAGPLLESGVLNSTTALAAFRKEVDTFGISSAPGAAAAADQWQGALGQLKLVMEGTGAKLLERFGPAATDLLQNFTLGLVGLKELGVIPLESAMNTLNEILGAFGAVVKADGIDDLKKRLAAVGAEFDRNQAQIEADTVAAMENVKAFYEASKATRDLAGAQGEGVDAGERYHIVNTKNAQEAAKAAAALQAEHDAIISLTLSIEAAQDPFAKLQQKLEKIKAAEDAGAVSAEEAARARRAAAGEWEDAVNKEVKATEEAAKKKQKAEIDALLEIREAEREKASEAKRLAEQQRAAGFRAASSLVGSLADLYQADIDAKQEAADAGNKVAQHAILEDFNKKQSAAIGQAAIDTALAVISQLATTPGPAGVAASIAAGVTGAVSIGKIASTPPPSFDDAALPPIGGQGRRTLNVHEQDYVAAAKDPTNLMKNAERATSGRWSAPSTAKQLAQTNVGWMLGRQLRLTVRGQQDRR